MFHSGEEVQNRFSRRRPSWIADQNNFSHFWLTIWFDTFYQVSSQLTFRIRRRRANQIFKTLAMVAILDFGSEWFKQILICKLPQHFLSSFKSIHLWVQKRKIDFQDGGHLGFPIVTILAIFDLQVTTMLPTKFWVYWPFSSEEAQNRFSRWWPSWISNRKKVLAIFDLRHPNAPNRVSSQLVQECRRSRLLKQIVKAAWCMRDQARWTLIDHTSSHLEHSMLRCAKNSIKE